MLTSLFINLFVNFVIAPWYYGPDSSARQPEFMDPSSVFNPTTAPDLASAQGSRVEQATASIDTMRKSVMAFRESRIARKKSTRYFKENISALHKIAKTTAAYTVALSKEYSAIAEEPDTAAKDFEMDYTSAIALTDALDELAVTINIFDAELETRFDKHNL